MKTNVIESQFKTRLDHDGSLEIVGKTQHRVLFRAESDNFLYAADISFAKGDYIQTSSLDTHNTVVFFEYNLQGELRNPRKLLKSVRNKLMRAINEAESKFHDEMNHLDWQMDKYLHVG